MIERILLRYTFRAFSHLCGGFGVFTLWAALAGAPVAPSAGCFLALAVGLMVAANRA